MISTFLLERKTNSEEYFTECGIRKIIDDYRTSWMRQSKYMIQMAPYIELISLTCVKSVESSCMQTVRSHLVDVLLFELLFT